jgi:hypothetical protein
MGTSIKLIFSTSEIRVIKTTRDINPIKPPVLLNMMPIMNSTPDHITAVIPIIIEPENSKMRLTRPPLE